MIERLLIVIGLTLVGFVLYKAFTVFQLRKAASALSQISGQEAGKYLILYFTSPTCVSCRTAQRPALKRVQDTFGDQLQIITIDVTEQPSTAEYWSVMTLPTTYVFDPAGTPQSYNPGVTYADKLIQQISSMGAQLLNTQQTAS